MKKIVFIFQFFVLTIQAQVVINEYSAANYDETDFLTGPGTNYADWIELYNTSSSPINISGYYLSDKLSNPQKWQIPVGTTIAANDHIIFLADGLDGFSAGNYHTNFKLTQTNPNEYIVFANATGTVLESIQLSLNPNKKNDSRGRMTDGSAMWGILETPSPNAVNNTTKERYALQPNFSIAPGFYPNTQTLVLSTTEPTSSIRYTTNGSEPTSTSTLYTAPITISTTTVIRAKTYSTNTAILSSHTETNTYFINENHSTKVISIAGGSALASLLGGNQSEPEGSLELFETDGAFLSEATGEFNKHGNDSWAYSQRGLDFVARDQFGKNHALLDEIFDNKNRDEFQRIILKCGASDNYPFEGQANANYPGEYGGAHIRDAYVNEMSQLGELSLDERSNEFAVMYVNGQYWGVYDIREKVDDSDFTNYYYNQDENNVQYLKTWGGTWAEYGGNQAITDWDNLVNFITGNDMTIPANYAYVDSVFNVNSLIDYFILNGFIVNADWLNWNTSWWRGLDPNGDKKKWRYTLWDMDASFNHYVNYSGVPSQSANSDPCNPDDLPNLGGQGHVPIWNALKENQDFFAAYANRYAELSSSVFSCDSMHNLLDSLVSEIAPEMPRHITRWGGSMAEWQQNVVDLHAFIDTRCATIITGLVNCDTALTGPYQLTLQVQPPGAGKIKLSSITPANYPFTATYFGGVNISIEADPNQCWQFDHWTINNDTLSPNNLTDLVNFDLQADDTITVYFTPTNCIYVNVVPPNAGSVIIDGVNITSTSSFESLTDSVNHTFNAIANTGFTFNNWDWQIHNPTPNSTSTNTIVYTYTNDTVTVNFNQIVLDTIVYIVNPPGAGSINVAGSVINTFPNTQYYTVGTNTTIVATPNAGFTFGQYVFDANIPLPNANTAAINVTWTSNDTIYINFNAIPTFPVTYLVNPNGAGSININGVNTNTFPTTINYNQGNTVNLAAIANASFNFNFWNSENHILLPNINNSNVNFSVMSQDTIIANFGEFITDTLWVVSNPINVATLEIGNDIVNTSPYMGIYEVGEILSINAIPAGNNVFNQWNLSGVNLADYNASTYFIFNNQDTLFAYFNNVLGIDALGSDIESISIYPKVTKENFEIAMYSLENTPLSIELYTINGQKMSTLFQGVLKANDWFKESFNIQTAAGIYFVKINTAKSSYTDKIIIIR